MRKYKKPVLNVEQFTANEFIALCGDSGKTYYFKCDAKKWGFDFGDSVYAETNDNPGLQRDDNNPDQFLGGYHSCSETHIAESDDEFLNGYFVPNGVIDTRPRKVIIWRGEDGNNIHCTTNLDISKWETAKS